MDACKVGLAFTGATVLGAVITRDAQFPMSILAGLFTFACGLIGILLAFGGHFEATYRHPHKEDFCITAASYLIWAGLASWYVMSSVDGVRISPSGAIVPVLFVGGSITALVQARKAPQ